jgi:uracil-DNA glycosylase family 4
MASVTGARTPRGVVSSAAHALDLKDLSRLVSNCRACARLVQWREHVAATKRAAYADQDYWGRPVPGFGAADASIGVLGLAPAAHGGNRTGRIFTGDRSGDVLFAALHRAGLASQPTSTSLDDGLELYHTRVFASVRCAPPANKPTAEERDTCTPWLHREVALLRPTLRVVIALGGFAWNSWWSVLSKVYGVAPPVPKPKFSHGAFWYAGGSPRLLGCYHVSQQNTFTGKLTPQMLDEVLERAKQLAGLR